VDALGRATALTGPNGNVTYMRYNDPAHEIRVYRGWDAATGRPTGPTELHRQDRAGGYTETLTFSGAPHLTGGLPDRSESVTGLESLRRDYDDATGQHVRSDAYFNLNDLSYSTGLYPGVDGTNYYTTAYAYDARGRQARTINPLGTITLTRFDALGRPTATYVGTNDATTDGQIWSPANAAAASNMTQLSSYE
jgi:YD repeat-containing protein